MNYTPQELRLPKKFKDWRPGQSEIIEQINSVNEFPGINVCFLDAPTGCHPLGQLILLWNGDIKPVESIKVGDYLMGPDSKPRQVMSLCRGYGKILEVIPVKGERFRINDKHILSLQFTKGIYKPNLGRRNKYRDGIHKGSGIYGGMKDSEIRDISIGDYQKFSKTMKHNTKLYRVPIKEFGGSNMPSISPYFLGALLGDGGIKNSITITSSHQILEMYSEAKRYGVRVLPTGKKGKARTYRLSIPRGGKNKNRLIEELKLLGLWGTGAGTKFIPKGYKLASVAVRLEILAGLMDTDGSVHLTSFDYVSKSKRLAEDVAFISRSVGLAAYIKPCWKKCQTGATGLYYRVGISGDCSIIPTRFRKASRRIQKKNVLLTGFTIKEIGEDNFYGFILDGDGRYLLGDFTVTHNTGKSLIAIGAYHLLCYQKEFAQVVSKIAGRECDTPQRMPRSQQMTRSQCVYVTRTKQLQNQILHEFQEARTIKGRNNYECVRPVKNKKATPRTAADCTHSADNPCEYRGTTCPYFKAKSAALMAPIAVLNTSYFLNEVNGPGTFSGAEMLIFDEVDQLESELLNHLQLVISEKQLNRFSIELPEKRERLEDWLSWASQLELSEIYHPIQLSLEETPESEWTNVEIGLNRAQKELVDFEIKLKQFVRDVTDDWIFYEEQKEDSRRWVFKPTLVGPLAHKYVWSHGLEILGMSATILDPGQLSRDLGDPTFNYFSLPCQFPRENRVINYVPTCSLTRKTMDRDLPLLLDKVAEIIAKYPSDKVLVHTVSYRIRNYLLANLPGNRIVTHNQQDRNEKLEMFKRSTRPLVMLSPSYDRGIDLPGDQCRCIIICKVPYPDLGDPQIKKRISLPGGQQWYNLKTVQTIVQMTGRGVRSTDDYCASYILDRQFGRILYRMKDTIPQWWLEALNEGGVR